MRTILRTLPFIQVVAAHATCPPPQVLDRATSNVIGFLVGPAGYLLGGRPVSAARAAYVRGLLEGHDTCGVTIIFDGAYSAVERDGKRAGMQVTLWPVHREDLRQVDGKWRDAAPVPTRAEIERDWLAAYDVAVAKLPSHD